MESGSLDGILALFYFYASHMVLETLILKNV